MATDAPNQNAGYVCYLCYQTEIAYSANTAWVVLRQTQLPGLTCLYRTSSTWSCETRHLEKDGMRSAYGYADYRYGTGQVDKVESNGRN
jgi:hypothetical protein